MNKRNVAFGIRPDKHIRVIIDTDTACEADDQYAIAHALMTPKFHVKGITAEHFNCEGSMERSFQEASKIVKLMGLEEEIPVFRGAEISLTADPAPIANALRTDAVRFIIDEALTDDPMPLYILCMGAATNVAAAIMRTPEIESKIHVIWIGGGAYPEGEWEFNLCNDYKAANLLFKSDVELWQVPNVAYARLRLSYAEIQEKVKPYGKIGNYLFKEMQYYGNSQDADWTMGESWSLGDTAAVGLAIDFMAGRSHIEDARVVDEHGCYGDIVKTDRTIRVYDEVDSRFMLEDFFAKLRIFFSE